MGCLGCLGTDGGDETYVVCKELYGLCSTISGELFAQGNTST